MALEQVHVKYRFRTVMAAKRDQDDGAWTHHVAGIYGDSWTALLMHEIVRMNAALLLTAGFIARLDSAGRG
jgi:hypothetical protein